jgi:hypothetical protein
VINSRRRNQTSIAVLQLIAPMPQPISLSRALILIPILSLAAAAQTPVSNWEIVRMLPPGTEIRVAVGAPGPGLSKPIQGTLESATDTDLVLTQRTGPQSFPRAQIASVSLKKPGHRVRNSFVGLGVGTAVGIVFGLALGAAQADNCHQFLCGLSVPIGGAVFGAIGLVSGTITGVAWPTGGWRKIYAP